MKRVMTVEPRDAGKWKREGTDNRKQAGDSGKAREAGFPKQAGETPDRWSRGERSVWTERMLKRLAGSQEQTVWFNLLGHRRNSDNLGQAILRGGGTQSRGRREWMTTPPDS